MGLIGPSFHLVSSGLWTSTEEFSHFGGNFSGDSRFMAMDGKLTEKWKSRVQWDSGGLGLCAEQRRLFLKVSWS